MTGRATSNSPWWVEVLPEALAILGIVVIISIGIVVMSAALYACFWILGRPV